MKRWRVNVYRVPVEAREAEREETRPQGDAAAAVTENDTSVWRQADSVYEDVM